MRGLVALWLWVAPSSFEAQELKAVQLPHAEGLALMAQWAAEHPDDPDLPRAWLWQAQLLLSDGRVPEARALLERIAATAGDSDLGWDARLTLCDALAAEGQLAAAAEAYRRLGAPPGSRWEMQARQSASEVDARLMLRRAVWGLGLALLGLLGARAFAARRRLWPPPEELTWPAPLLLLLAVAAWFRSADERGALMAVALGGLVLLWVNGAFLKSSALSVPRRVLESALGLAQVAVLLFCACVLSGLWPRVVDTFAGGVE